MLAKIAEELAAVAALNHHEAPHDPKGDGGDNDVAMEEETHEEENHPVVSYAQAAANTKTLELHFVREDKGSDFNLDEQQMSDLIYKRLLLPKGKLVSLDTTPYRKIVLEIDGSVDIADLNITQGLEAKNGLKTRPLQSPDTDREIRINRAPMKASNEEITKVLELFGEITKPIQHVVYGPPPPGTAEDSWQYMMSKVKTAERTIRMKIKVNIPSFIVVQGNKLKVDYPGQPKTCPRCQKYWSTCPGQGKVEKCKKAGGEEKDVKTSFKQLVSRIKKKEKGVGDIESSAPVVPKVIPNPDQISFLGLPEDMTLDAFQVWLDQNSITFLGAMCFKGNKPGTFVLASYENNTEGLVTLEAGEAKEIVTKLHGVELNKKRVIVQMESLTTPAKDRRPEVVTLDDTKSPPKGSQPPPAGGVQRNQKAERQAKMKERRAKARYLKKAKAAAAAETSKETSKAAEGTSKDDPKGVQAKKDDADLTVSDFDFLSPEANKAMKVVVGKRSIQEVSPSSSNEASPILNGKKTSPWQTGSQERKKKNLPKKTKHVL